MTYNNCNTELLNDICDIRYKTRNTFELVTFVLDWSEFVDFSAKKYLSFENSWNTTLKKKLMKTNIQKVTVKSM